ncbi:retrotransposon protein, putative, ty1-copia subclass, partial [Tanacetum coccineum]
LVAVDYVSKWVEVQALPTNDARVVVKFLKGLFARFGVPKALISDRGTHFCNSQLEKALLKYGDAIRHILGFGIRRIDYLYNLAVRKSTICTSESINKGPFSSPQWVNLFQTNENVYRELVREFFASFDFDASPCRESVTLSGLRKGVTVKANYLLLGFWPTIRDDGFNVGNTKVAAIKDPRVKLAHRSITTTIAGRKKMTHRVTEIDLLYLYCIYSNEVVCNIPYWLAKYMVGMREKSLICGGMFATRIARSYGLLTSKMIRELSVEPSPHAVEEYDEDDEGDEAAGGDAGHEGAGGSADMYHNMIQSDWQVRQARWMDQLYLMRKQLGSLRNSSYDTWRRFNQLSHTAPKCNKKKPRGAKGKDKGKNKLTYTPKPKILPPPKRHNPAKDFVCHHCKEVGHWRRNCPSYQAELKEMKNASVASTSCIFTIELYGLRESKKLKHEALSLYMGNEMCVVVEAIRSFDLILPSGLIIVLDNCHFAPSVTRGVVLISRLVNNGYIHTFTNYGISVSKDNVFYFNAIPRDGIYEIDMHNLYPNVSSMFNVSNKRAKHALDSSYLWHCRLGHINKKRMDKLQRDGILQPTHDESLEKCKSCISGKMARKPFPHQVERAKDLLGLIHTDVCGPFRTVSREGASYFITFTDDFSRYGYVYLMKHKHEVFETFKEVVKIQRDNGRDLRKSLVTIEENLKVLNEASGSHGLLKSSGSDGGIELIQKEDTQPSENTSEIHNEVAPIEVEPQNVEVHICISARIPQAPDRYGFYVDVEEFELGDLNEPPNYKAALLDPDFDKWLEAINTKMQSMKDNQVTVLVDLPPNGRTVGSKWLFKKKTNMDGNVHTFKARLVAKGYTQTYGVDYEETFSPVVNIRNIRILLAIAMFLNGHLSEDVYMVQPKGINKIFDVEIKKVGFTQNPDEPRVYLKASGSNVVFLILYVDDILLMGNNITMLQEVKSWLWVKPEAELKVSCYADASFQLDENDTKSQTGYVFVLNEAEYIDAAEALMESVWMNNLLMDLEVSCHLIKDLWRCYVTMSLQ